MKDKSNQRFDPEQLANINYSDLDPSLSREEILKAHHENVKKLNLQDALDYDRIMFEKTITVPDDAPQPAKDSAETIKRITKLVGHSEMELSNYSAPEGIDVESTRTLPIASLLAHGGRIIVAVPKGKGEELVQAIAGDAELTTRLTSTHDISINDKGEFKEKNGQFVGLKNSFSKNNKNRGLNINIGGYGERDIHGNNIGNESGATGENGHVLFYTTSRNNKDFVLIGIEGSAPGKNGSFGFHGLGKKNELSAFGTVKMDKIEKDFENKNYIIPGKESMRIQLDQQQYDEIIPIIKSHQTEVPYDKPVKLKGGVESYIGNNSNESNEIISPKEKLEKVEIANIKKPRSKTIFNKQLRDSFQDKLKDSLIKIDSNADETKLKTNRKRFNTISSLKSKKGLLSNQKCTGLSGV
jgi:Novel toxin 11